jgi:hypothetical protein
MEHTLQEIRIDAILDTLKIQSVSGREVFKAQTQNLRVHPSLLTNRSEGWRRLRRSAGWIEEVPQLLEDEAFLRKMNPADASESQKEDWSQILFSGQFASLNFVPFLLMYVAVSKIVLAPLFAWSMPVLSIVLPFLAMIYIYRMPITWEMYWASVKPMFFGRSGGGWSVASMLQWGSMIASYAHGMYIPYTNAKHTYNIDQLLVKTAGTFRRTFERLERIRDAWKAVGIVPLWSFPDSSTYGDERQIAAWLVEDPNLLPEVFRAIGTVEVYARIAECSKLQPVNWIESRTPFCKMEGAADCLIEPSKQVPFSLYITPNQHHAIVTGPNRGGKSTFLRATLTNIVFAQTWGVAFAEQCTLTPVDWILSSLRLEDRPGEQSLFEREVSVAGEILERARQGTRGWVIIDELFHTTNPPDAQTASQIFLQQLWGSQSVSSLVSTHLFAHAETAPQDVQRLCLESFEEPSRPNGVVYTYKVQEGINTMSSVFEILEEAKVLGAAENYGFKTLAPEIEDPNVE